MTAPPAARAFYPCYLFGESKALRLFEDGTGSTATTAENESMQIFVRTDRTKVLTVEGETKAEHVKRILEEKYGLPSEECFLSFNGRVLPDGASLAACGVSDDSTLFAHLRLLGGGKKRKKKTYSKPKKAKHKHKNVKLRMLKVYKVDDSGKVQRLRKQCPKCGPGIFMATHFDRVYCGKCTLTYLYECD